MGYSTKPPRGWYWLGSHAMALVTTLLARWGVEGAEQVPKEGPLIVIANHFSFLDPPLLAASFPRPLTFVAKAELWAALPSRLFCQATGLLPLRRGEPDLGALRAMGEVLKQGGAIAFFPEGTRGRTQPQALKQAHRGIALLARLSDAPLVPVGIAGTDVINAPSDIFAALLRRPSFTVRIGELFRLPTGAAKRSPGFLAAQTEAIMVQIARQLPERYWGVYADQTRGVLESGKPAAALGPH